MVILSHERGEEGEVPRSPAHEWGRGGEAAAEGHDAMGTSRCSGRFDLDAFFALIRVTMVSISVASRAKYSTCAHKLVTCLPPLNSPHLDLSYLSSTALTFACRLTTLFGACPTSLQPANVRQRALNTRHVAHDVIRHRPHDAINRHSP